MALPENFIYELKQNNPIDSLVSSYTTLKRSGHNQVCLCPFHSEKSPSCTIYNDTQSFYCFGCGAGGDVITFAMKIENLSYIEAVKFLADRAGMQMPDEAKNNDSSRIKARILEINRVAARFFHDVLTKYPEGEKGRRYFRERQLTNATIVKYGLGYAPDDWHKLHYYMNSKGYSDEELVIANLCLRSRNGGVFDAFRDRVIFPIIDLRGNVTAFGGRIIDGSGPKYLNSSDTPVFKKSRSLFSLNFAKKSDEKRLILAEGYMDVISINQAGFDNVVATLGTALTSEQARLMKQYADEVIIAYDSDGPGQAATHKAINLLSDAGAVTKIIKMEGAKDPDEYIKKFGAMRFKQLIDRSDGALDFEIRKCAVGLDLETEQDKSTYLRRCVKMLAGISSPLDRELYISKIAKETDVSRETLAQQINGLIKKNINAAEKNSKQEIETFAALRRKNPESVAHPKEFKAEKGIIAYLAANPDGLKYIESRISPDCFVTDFNKRLYEKMTEKIKSESYYDIMSLQSEFSADEMGKITEIIVNSKGIDINRLALDDYIAILNEYKDRDDNVGDLSNDDFLQYVDKMKKLK
ncbi:MAG: DNA primase [Oscillospiraceae bacterium]|nr:DNA primase [Oscillospiraceae bacterium]